VELLAPAGSKESLVSAIRAGADSVYAGVPGFNARLNADSFSLYDLEVAADYARSNGRKLYLALNTLIKHSEIDAVVKILYRARNFKPDALIVQDLGIARVLKEQFPELPLHASTQLAVHNSYGVETLSRLAFRRVILARELSFAELKLIARKAPAELEVFCHGALCFCVSGMCLFSSVMGAMSGNRGRCTQPCRRIWEGGGKGAGPGNRGYYFSPRDLELAGEIPGLKKLGIKALKIEGRMRSSEYVFNTVRAYRMLIDAAEPDFSEALKEARGILSEDYARGKTAFLFSDKAPELFSPHEPQCLGKKIGFVTGSAPGILSVKTGEPVKSGDRLRVSDPKSDRTAMFKVGEFRNHGGGCDIVFQKGSFPPGSLVYKCGDSRWNERELTREVDEMYASFGSAGNRRAGQRDSYSNSYTALIARQWITKEKDARERLWVRIGDPGWLDALPENAGNRTLVLALNRENMHAFRQFLGRPRLDARGVVCELPPFIRQWEIREYRQVIDDLAASGIRRWSLNNISQFGFFVPAGTEITAGHFLYAWNAFSARALKDLGAEYFTVSWEDDFLNIRDLAASGLRGRLVVYLYGYPAVARSRMVTKATHNEGVFADRDNRFRMVHESGCGVLLPLEPVMLFNARAKLNGLGIRNFGIDLSYVKPGKNTWEGIYSAYCKRENFDGSIKFNFKRLVK
jgi:U32 family peptidase